MSKKRKIAVVCANGSAVIPSNAHSSDAGYDLTVIALVKDYGNGVYLYDTGLQLIPMDTDVYFDLVARSSLPKMGYMLANSVGIIDNEYRGNVMIQLYKFDPNAAPLSLPCRVAQLIPRRMLPVEFEETVETMTTTARGDGGFGSTN